MSDYSDYSTPRPGEEKERSRARRCRDAFSSLHGFNEALKLKSSTSVLVNEDLLPSPPENQTWTAWNFFAYWWSESWSVSTWSMGSAMISLGGNIRDCLLIVLFVNVLAAVVICLNGRAASRYHIGFPVLARVTFGIWGSYFVVVLRAILGIIWGGVQLYFEGQFISIALRCIFPGWWKIRNGIPADQHITTQTMVGFLIAFLCTIPFMFIHTTKIRHLFTLKSVVLPFTGLGLVIWSTSSNGGVSASSILAPSARTSTSVFAWGLVGQFNSVMGASSALLVTVPDLARYSKTKNAQLYGQAIGLPLANVVCSAFGIITTSAVMNMYGIAYWNPYDLLNGILDDGYTSKARAGVFFTAVAFAFATLGTSIACNIIPFAADVTCLLPKYINIIRGQFICLIIAFAIVPWRVVATANGFLNFLSGYSIFQGPVVAIMIVDYFIIRKGNLDIEDMYNLDKMGTYWYTGGVNWRAFVSFVVGFLLPLPGFVASFGYEIGSAATHLYELGWVLSFLMGGMCYWLLCKVFHVPGYNKSAKWEEKVSHGETESAEGSNVQEV